MIDLVCVRCGREMREHAGRFDLDAGRYVCPDGGLSDEGSLLVETHFLDGVPPSERHARRAALAQAEMARRRRDRPT